MFQAIVSLQPGAMLHLTVEKINKINDEPD